MSRRAALHEAATNTVVGFVGSWAIAYMVVFANPFDVLGNTTLITGLCTVWSFIRGYMVRRYYAKRV